tara:strand:- start:134305 stop:135729 length:1425 start_codon:yes stop_codon:yes gene_type:complete
MSLEQNIERIMSAQDSNINKANALLDLLQKSQDNGLNYIIYLLSYGLDEKLVIDFMLDQMSLSDEYREKLNKFLLGQSDSTLSVVLGTDSHKSFAIWLNGLDRDVLIKLNFRKFNCITNLEEYNNEEREGEIVYPSFIETLLTVCRKYPDSPILDKAEINLILENAIYLVAGVIDGYAGDDAPYKQLDMLLSLPKQYLKLINFNQKIDAWIMMESKSSDAQRAEFLELLEFSPAQKYDSPRTLLYCLCAFGLDSYPIEVSKLIVQVLDFSSLYYHEDHNGFLALDFECNKSETLFNCTDNDLSPLKKRFKVVDSIIRFCEEYSLGRYYMGRDSQQAISIFENLYQKISIYKSENMLTNNYGYIFDGLQSNTQINISSLHMDEFAKQSADASSREIDRIESIERATAAAERANQTEPFKEIINQLLVDRMFSQSQASPPLMFGASSSCSAHDELRQTSVKDKEVSTQQPFKRRKK